MLAQLKIKDFAIIDDLTIDFYDKMTVLTGETGSGKSIIIDAISLLIGERASNEMIRFDKEKAVIEGIFYYDNLKVFEFLEENGIDSNENTLIINREISKNGRNLCRINGTLVTVNQLKQLGSYLVDIHVQHDTTRLINTSNYLYLLDSFADSDFASSLKEYVTIYDDYNKTIKEYQTLIKENANNKERSEFYKYQLEEFINAKINLDDYNNLLSKHNVITNYDKIYENLNKAYTNISEGKILEKLYESANNLSKIGNIKTNLLSISEQLFNIYYQLEDYQSQLDNEIASLDYNPKELDSIESRLSIYSALKRKYKMEVEELINYRDTIATKITQIDNFEDIIERLTTQLKEKYLKMVKSAIKLRAYRENCAKTIEEQLIGHLKDLRLHNTSFKIVFNEISIKDDDYLNNSNFTETGFDIVDFHVTFNLGEPLRPLAKVASGGELSRFMLGLKTILTERQKLSTVIFDEIDSGVSGITAGSIADKIKKIGENTQVFCITHLPQVASIADYHLFISKTEKNDRTITNVKLLNMDERIMEIAKMISGNKLNDIVIENAKNLLKLNN